MYEKLFSFVVNETVFVQSFNEEFYTCLDETSNVGVELSVELSIVYNSCRKHSLMYQLWSMITVPDPLSAALMIMSVRWRSCVKA